MKLTEEQAAVSLCDIWIVEIIIYGFLLNDICNNYYDNEQEAISRYEYLKLILCPYGYNIIVSEPVKINQAIMATK
jgi:hypothetical protein